ncbi:hypothetical protein BS47DRAFT_1357744 [Hydnum rufescens UP504]|uniref:Uncharacterized protein n=1 Tax=Hydnum rufescens UP504 TaxID=1448309 RepID=A0A9P6B914_9AGAM|nr:hypothetical protein BS47DRAFT_1357744 [Hydnum rufescens UP504]
MSVDESSDPPKGCYRTGTRLHASLRELARARMALVWNRREIRECGKPPGDPTSWLLDQRERPIQQRLFLWILATVYRLREERKRRPSVLTLVWTIDQKESPEDEWSMSASSMAPSQFATLLRRSKFASYDPAIYQIYTSYGGHSARGDFGVKRPLPPAARTRSPNAFINNLDTRQHQTQWKDAEMQQKFVQRFDEIGAPVKPVANSIQDDRSRNAEGAWVIDSDYDSKELEIKDKDLSVLQPLTFMTPKDFKRSVAEARRLGPEFRDFVMRRQDEVIKGLQKGRPIPKSDLYQLAQTSSPNGGDPSDEGMTQENVSKAKENVVRRALSNVHRDFLAHRAKKRFATFGASTSIAPSVHPTGGLSYHHPSDLQTILTNPSVPGHVFIRPDPRRNTIPRQRELEQKFSRFVVGIGGISSKIETTEVMTESTGSMAKDNRVVPFNFFPKAELSDQERMGSKRSRRGRFRLEIAALHKAPTVVKEGTQEPDVDGTNLELNARAWMSVKQSRPNPYIPGTPPYDRSNTWTQGNPL